MSATITWTIQKMSCYPQAEGQTDVVFQVFWQCLGVQTTDDILYKGVNSQVTDVTYTAGTPYTPYDQLTQAQVLGWVWQDVDQAVIEANVQAQIDAQIVPPVLNLPLPWATLTA
jgi:hypothetical protein